MRIKLKKLKISTKKEPVEIEFKKFNYFWGPIGTGKSTIARLIMYCFGKNMKETPALHKEFIGAQLFLEIEENDVSIERKKEENMLTVTFSKKDSEEVFHVRIPAKLSSGPSQITGKEVINMSDLIFYLSDLVPPRVLQSKIKTDTKLIRLGFKDLMWYSYLEQDSMDSSFFYLGEGEDRDRQRKSRDVMNYVLGYYQEKVTMLEKKLIETREDQKTSLDSAQKLQAILNENYIDNTEKTLEEKQKMTEKLNELEREILEIRNKTFHKENNVIVELKQERKYLVDSISELGHELDSIQENIEKQSRLKNEFLMTALRSDKIHLASQIFKKLPFHTCPKCGQEKKQNQTSQTCSLCDQPMELDEKKELFNSELHDRAKELEFSIKNLRHEISILESRGNSKRKELNEIELKINELTEADDSKYIQETSHMLNEKGTIKGKLDALEQLLPLPKKVDDLENHAHELEGEISKIKSDLEKARKEAEKNTENMEKLKVYFLDNLKRAKFPEISKDYEVFINTKNFYPYIKSKAEGELDMLEFFNAGSGGKKTLFKTCFALAVHRLANELEQRLPSLIVIDSPMKNIHKSENKEIFVGMHKLIHELSKNELKDIQFIIIGSHELPEEIKDSQINKKQFTNDILSSNPPLIPYYSGQ